MNDSIARGVRSGERTGGSPRALLDGGSKRGPSRTPGRSEYLCHMQWARLARTTVPALAITGRTQHLCPGRCSQTPRARWPNPTSVCCWARAGRDGAPAQPGAGEGPFPAYTRHFFALSSQGAGRDRLSGSLFIKVLTPFTGTPPSQSNLLPKTPIPLHEGMK